MGFKSITGATCACLAVVSFNANSALLTFTNEADYLAALSSSTVIFEDFDTSPWFNTPGLYSGGIPSFTNQGLTWSSAQLIELGSGWAKTDGNSSGASGIYSSKATDPDFLKVTSGVGTIYGVGGWIRGATGPQGATDITFTLDSVEVFTTNISDVHQFVGVIDTDGFATMSFAASSGEWGADDFTFATSPVPIPSAVWLFGSGLIGLVGLARRKANA